MKEKTLAKYRGCAGLPTDMEAWKKAIPYRPGEIDYEQPANRMIRLTPETAEYLYTEYTPLETHYEPDTRPKCERHVAMAVCNAKTERDRALALMEWACHKVACPRGMSRELAVHGGTEEGFLERGYGVCNEVSRVFVTLCQVARIPARMTFHWTEDSQFGHSAAEAYFDGKWTLCDTEINVSGVSVEGLQANCREMMTERSVREAFDRYVTRDMLKVLGMTDAKLHYSDYFRVMGICNYPIEEFPYKVRPQSHGGPNVET